MAGTGRRGFSRESRKVGVGSPPACDGSGIAILHAAVDTANYAREVQRALDASPSARYLRTERSCPSLSPVDANGNTIY